MKCITYILQSHPNSRATSGFLAASCLWISYLAAAHTHTHPAIQKRTSSFKRIYVTFSNKMKTLDKYDLKQPWQILFPLTIQPKICQWWSDSMILMCHVSVVASVYSRLPCHVLQIWASTQARVEVTTIDPSDLGVVFGSPDTENWWETSTCSNVLKTNMRRETNFFKIIFDLLSNMNFNPQLFTFQNIDLFGASSGGIDRFLSASKVGVGRPQWSALIRTMPSSSEAWISVKNELSWVEL